MQGGIFSSPPSFDAAHLQEHQSQLHFLCHRPILEVEAAALEADQAAAAKAAAAVEAARGIPVGFVRIEAGKFTMGSPESEAGHFKNESPCRVKLTRAFWYQATPVTQGQWKSLIGQQPVSFSYGRTR